MWCQHAWFWMLLPLLATTEGAAAHYKWEQGSGRYYAVERGRMLTLVEVRVLETSDPLNGSVEVLLEPCKSGHQRRLDEPPCWPQQERERTQDLLASLYREARDYRGRPTLLRVARVLNRDIGTFRKAWVIGTNPLTVAFLDGPPDQIPANVQPLIDQLREMTAGPDAKTKLKPTTRPGFFELVTRSGETVSVDHRVRDARLVTDADLEAQVDYVLLYPQNMPFLGAGQRPAPGVDPPHRVKVFQLPEPESIESVMRSLTEPGKLEREAKKVEEVPVALHP